jgi:hypothetical protein
MLRFAQVPNRFDAVRQSGPNRTTKGGRPECKKKYGGEDAADM